MNCVIFLTSISERDEFEIDWIHSLIKIRRKIYSLIYPCPIDKRMLEKIKFTIAFKNGHNQFNLDNASFPVP
jgi:hypothetical protein